MGKDGIGLQQVGYCEPYGVSRGDINTFRARNIFNSEHFTEGERFFRIVMQVNIEGYNTFIVDFRAVKAEINTRQIGKG